MDHLALAENPRFADTRRLSMLCGVGKIVAMRLVVLGMVARLDRDPDHLGRFASEAFARNEDAIDVDACVRRLMEAVGSVRFARYQS